MNIKKSIVGSLFSMLLVSEMAAADWGDVYYCQMTNFIGITLDGEKVNLMSEKFKFKLDQTKNAMVFVDKDVITGHFGNRVLELDIDRSRPSQDSWYVNDEYFMIHFTEGKFVSAWAGSGIWTLSADCDKF